MCVCVCCLCVVSFYRIFVYNVLFTKCLYVLYFMVMALLFGEMNTYTARRLPPTSPCVIR